MAVLLLAFTVAVLLLLGSQQRKQINKLKDQLRPIEAIDLYTRTARRNADSELAKAKQEAERITSAARSETSELERQTRLLQAEARSAREELELINEGLALKADDAHLLEVGYYEPVYGFEDLPSYQEEIGRIKQEQKAMLRISGENGDRSAAAYATTMVSYNGSEAQGRKLLRKVLRLMLRAFNGECDAFIARTTYRNVMTMQKRIRSAFEQVNKIAAIWNCELNNQYMHNRLKELGLVYEYSELQERIKEQQAWIREQQREDEKARKEAVKREKEASQKAEAVEKAVHEARQALEEATAKDKAVFRERIEALERQLAAALEEKQRAQSLAQQTRAGFVYIFSNIGSFGEDVFKIGMTRREDPEERRRELGAASVPFPFDCHAYIWTEDAPTLERELQKHFEAQRLNLQNDRKEFFRITIEEIHAEVERLREGLGITAEIQWTMLAEAKDFRLSEAKRRHLEGDDGSSQ